MNAPNVLLGISTLMSVGWEAGKYNSYSWAAKTTHFLPGIRFALHAFVLFNLVDRVLYRRLLDKNDFKNFDSQELKRMAKTVGDIKQNPKSAILKIILSSVLQEIIYNTIFHQLTPLGSSLALNKIQSVAFSLMRLFTTYYLVSTKFNLNCIEKIGVACSVTREISYQCLPPHPLVDSGFYAFETLLFRVYLHLKHNPILLNNDSSTRRCTVYRVMSLFTFCVIGNILGYQQGVRSAIIYHGLNKLLRFIEMHTEKV